MLISVVSCTKYFISLATSISVLWTGLFMSEPIQTPLGCEKRPEN